MGDYGVRIRGTRFQEATAAGLGCGVETIRGSMEWPGLCGAVGWVRVDRRTSGRCASRGGVN
jgi:hypothetical protein